jgi:hypothetical protein
LKHLTLKCRTVNPPLMTVAILKVVQADDAPLRHSDLSPTKPLSSALAIPILNRGNTKEPGTQQS